MKSHVTTTINGDPVEFLCEPAQTLLQVLRNDLGMTGTKEGCGSGDCGACSVIFDGELVCACLVLGVEAEGAERVTCLVITEHNVDRNCWEKPVSMFTRNSRSGLNR